MHTASLWGWLLAACLAVLVGCCVITVNAHNTLNEYKALRTQDMQKLRQEIVDASLSRDEQLKYLINNNYDQLKQYMEVQITLKARDAVLNVSPIVVNQTASPSVNANPQIQINK